MTCSAGAVTLTGAAAAGGVMAASMAASMAANAAAMPAARAAAGSAGGNELAVRMQRKLTPARSAAFPLPPVASCLPQGRRGGVPAMKTLHARWLAAVFAIALPPCSSVAAQSAPDAAKTLPAPADVAAPPADAQVTASGLASKVLQPGTGSDHPLATDKVKVHYTGWTTDGKMFDSSVARGKPALFPLDKVIAGWTEGVQLMVEGETRRFWIPEKLAYGGRPD